MAGFVECLDSEEAEEGMETEEGNMENVLTCCCCFHKMLYSHLFFSSFFFLTDRKCSEPESQKKVARIRHETQIHILNLLITSLELKPPNLALHLLGYEVKKPVSSTNLQDPGDASTQTPAVQLGPPCCWTDCELLCRRCVRMPAELPARHPESAAERHREAIGTRPCTAGPAPGRALLPGAHHCSGINSVHLVSIVKCLFFCYDFFFLLPLAGDLPAVRLPRHVRTHHALFKNQPGLPVFPPAALTFQPAR